jgi:hypothetical protein
MARREQQPRQHRSFSSLSVLAESRLTLFFRDVATTNPRTRFLIYSRRHFAAREVASAWGTTLSRASRSCGAASSRCRCPAAGRARRFAIRRLPACRANTCTRSLDCVVTPRTLLGTLQKHHVKAASTLGGGPIWRFGDCRSRRSRTFITMLRMATTTSVQSAMPSAQAGVKSIPITSVIRS